MDGTTANRLIRGADVSTLLEVEECGGKFFDGEGNPGDALEILKANGVGLIRLRLWNDPYDRDGTPYGAGTNDLKRTEILAKRAKSLGLPWLLAFHYSDFWADPGKQITPKAWQGLTGEALERAIYEYTLWVLKELRAQNLLPRYVAVGNELSNGLLWPEGRYPNFPAIARYVSAGIRAVREIDPEIRVMIHLDNGGKNSLYREWFDSYFDCGGEDFDLIGLSYYPFWHGSMADLRANMRDVAERYGKDLLVAETSMGFTLEDYAGYEGLSKDERKGMAATAKLAGRIEYPMTPEGQRQFLLDLADAIKSVPEGRGLGFIYWEPAWIPVPGSEWANAAALRYTGERGPGGNEWANQALFDYNGRALPALGAIRDL